MIDSRRMATLVVLLAVFYFMFPRKTYAYLDPGTGSYILQLIIAGLFGVAFAVKIYWRNVKAFFSNLFSKGQKGREEDDNE